MPLDLGDIASIGDLWFWFQLTGSCLVWVVTFGSVWMLVDHPHLAGLIGVLFHVAVVAGVVFFWSGSSSGQQGNA